MLVGKDELKNTWQLTKVRLSSVKSGRLRLLMSLVGIVYLVNLVAFFIWFRPNENGLDSFAWQDYSALLFGALLLSIIVYACLYRTDNQKFAVFPQTNTSRFISSQAFIYTLIVACALLVLVLYLITYGIVALLATAFNTVYLVYAFDPLFIISGFFVFLMYLIVFASMVSLVAALIRKFKLYAILAIAIIIGVIIARPSQMLELLEVIFGFILMEHSVLLFLIKGIALWAVLFALSFIINRFTVYYKETIRITGLRVAVVVLASALIFAVPTFFKLQETNSEAADDLSMFAWTRNAEQILIDISALPEGSRIDIRPGNNIALVKDTEKLVGTEYEAGRMRLIYQDGIIEEYPEDYVVVYYNESLSNISGGTLVITFTRPLMERNSHDLIPLSNPVLEARLEGSTLHLDYNFDSVKAVFTPIWSFMNQFDDFRDKGFVYQYFATFNHNSSADISVWVD